MKIDWVFWVSMLVGIVVLFVVIPILSLVLIR